MASTKGRMATPILTKVVNKGIQAFEVTEPGHVHAKLPFKYQCKEGRTYLWCSCGWSRTQPFCDGTHNYPKFKIKNRPIRFECQKSGEYWFCQCKHTESRPFCDGSHNNDLVKSAKSTVQMPVE